MVGSSPHTRGARHHHRHRRAAMGIIPAYAGSTRSRLISWTRWVDHPRIRGEHTDSLQPGDIVFGSSPHTRGAPAKAPPTSGTARIIPAYAGSTSTMDQLLEAFRDHPRIRGEHVE